MGDVTAFDPTFDFRTDAGGGDPDKTSPTLLAYHKHLWSKPLPSGDPFALDDSVPGTYLLHKSNGLEFFLSSDTSVPTWSERWSQWTQRDAVIGALPDAERKEFDTITYQMGAMMLFPGNQIDRQWTLNQARGCSPRIVDRLDLTVECIRRFYLGEVGKEANPLGPTIARYRSFFDLFEDFDGYVDFFLLQDLVSEDRSAVRFFLNFTGFQPYPFPATVDDYLSYRHNAVEFIRSRNYRMKVSWSEADTPS